MAYLDSLKAGIAKANLADAAKKEVNSVFAEVGEALSFLEAGFVVKIFRDTSTLAAVNSITAGFIKTPSEFMPQDIVMLRVESAGLFNQGEVARWRQHVDGLPCTLTFQGEEYFCSNGEDLRFAFNTLFSTASFARQLVGYIEEIKSALSARGGESVGGDIVVNPDSNKQG